MFGLVQQASLVVVAYWYSLWRGKAATMPLHPSRVAVIQLAKLGDMVCTTPVFNALQYTYPNAQIIVVGNALNQELLAGHPSVYEYIVWKRGDFWNMVRLLREAKIDVVCLTSPSTQVLATAYLARIKAVVCFRIENGWSPYETRSYKLIRKLCVVVPYCMGEYAPREYLRLLEPLGISTNNSTKTLVCAESAVQKSLTYIQGLGSAKIYIGIAPSAGNKIKEWPPERFALIADGLVEKYDATILVIGSEHDNEEVDEMMRHVSHTNRVFNTCGKFSIEELKAIVRQLTLFISADTGPIYIAEAFGIPTIDIVGPMDENEQPPVGPLHAVVIPKGSRTPQLHIMNARVYDEQEAIRQAQAATVEEVRASIEQLLNLIATHT